MKSLLNFCTGLGRKGVRDAACKLYSNSQFRVYAEKGHTTVQESGDSIIVSKLGPGAVPAHCDNVTPSVY